jgi:hypothetical protein
MAQFSIPFRLHWTKDDPACGDVIDGFEIDGTYADLSSNCADYAFSSRRF